MVWQLIGSSFTAISLGFCIQESLGLPWAFLGGPTDRVGDSINFFVRPLSKLCISDVHLRIREKHDFILQNIPTSKFAYPKNTYFLACTKKIPHKQEIVLMLLLIWAVERYETQKNPGVSFIDPKKSLLAKLSGLKKSLVGPLGLHTCDCKEYCSSKPFQALLQA